MYLSQKEKKRHPEYEQYIALFEETITQMESGARGRGAPEAIIERCLDKALEFYDADSAALVETNLDLGYGDLYTQILQLRFMQEASRTDDEVSELLGLERSTYYDRKKEAILLIGISLWGYVIPTTMSVYRRVELMSVPEEDFFAMVSAEQSKNRSKAT